MNPSPAASSPLSEVAGLFLKLGITAFGGPAAHIAMMHDELVRRRKWLDDQEFLDLLGATNLIPGPNSTEMAIHLGFLRAGWPGLLLGGVCFIVPAMLIVLVFAWVYVRYGTTPQVEWLLYGVKPVVIAIVVQALWGLGRIAVKGGLGLILAVGVIIGYFLNANVLLLLLVSGLVAMLATNRQRLRAGFSALLWLPAGSAALGTLNAMPAATVPFRLSTLFLTFLKIGSVLYGGGYVLLAFLRADLVVRYGWLTDQQLIDAIAMGQVTPGPLFTTATFIGYLVGGVPGALVATLGIFLPSFIFVALSNPLIPRLRQSSWFAGMLNGVNVASLGLMAAVTWQLALSSLIDPLTLALALCAFSLLVRARINATWLIATAAAIGFLARSLA